MAWRGGLRQKRRTAINGRFARKGDEGDAEAERQAGSSQKETEPGCSVSVRVHVCGGCLRSRQIQDHLRQGVQGKARGCRAYRAKPAIDSKEKSEM